MDLNQITTILDKPKHDQVAWRRSLLLQEQSGTAIEVVSFVWNAMCENTAALNAVDRRKLRRSLIDKRRQWLQDLVAKSPRSRSGDIAQRIIYGHDIGAWVEDEFADKCPDLVVKTVHKSASLVHSPTDWDLLRTSPAPILLTTRRRGKFSGNIVASLDLRQADTKHRHLNCKVLEAAFSFANLYQAKMHVVFVVELSQILRDLDIINERVSKAKVMKKVGPELERLLKPYHIPKSRVHTPVGKVGKVVAQVSRKLNADLLVIGSYAHRAKRLVGFGNSAERIVTKAVGDVLVVHP